MKTYFLDTLNRYKRFSEKLDAKTILCNKSWWIFNDSGEKEIYIFQEDGSLIISFNGKVTHATWQYIPANKSLVISTSKESYMLHPAFVDENIFALQQDGTNKFAFMIDESQKANFAPRSLRELTYYFEEKETKRIQEEQRQQQLYIEQQRIAEQREAEQQRIAYQQKLEQEREQRVEALRTEAARLWVANKEQILKNDNEYIAYKKKRKRKLVILKLSTIAWVLGTIHFFMTANEPINNIFEAIVPFATPILMAFVIILGISMIGANSSVLEEKRKQYIDNYVRAHQRKSASPRKATQQQEATSQPKVVNDTYTKPASTNVIILPSNIKAPLRDEIFPYYATFLVSILNSCRYESYAEFIRIKLEKNFLLYFGEGKKSSYIQNLSHQDFIEQFNAYSTAELKDTIQQFRAKANEDEIKFCKANLKSFATVCNLETKNQISMQQATYICDAISINS